MSKTINIVFDPTKSVAPLYAKYQNEILPQPAFVTLNVETGEVDADYNGEIGNAVPMNVWHGVVRRYNISNTLSSDQVANVLEEIKPLLERVLDGGSVEWDGSNWVGELTEDAEQAEQEIEGESQGQGLGYDIEGHVIDDLESWLSEAGTDGWMPDESQDVNEFIKIIKKQIEAEGWVTASDIGDVLTDMWAEHLYSGEFVQSNVAQYLQTDGRCSDSAWVDELADYARGEIPGDD